MSRIKIIITIVLILLGIVIGTTKVNAASANITASSTDVTVGTPVTISVNIYGAAWQINVSGAVSGVYSDNTDDAEDSTITKTLSFTPTSAGSYTINLSGNVTGSADTRATNVSGSVTINVKDAQASNNDNGAFEPQNNNGNNENSSSSIQKETSISSNANLANLGIYTYDFKGFRAANTSYNTTVPNDVTSVSVYAVPQDSGATYTVSGNTNLDVGTNKVVITVTAADKKTKKTYYIYVARKENEEKQEEVIPNAIDEKNEEKQDEEPLKVISIAIDDESEIYLEPEFKSDIYEYIINLKDKNSEKKIDKIPLKVVTNNEEAKIEILGNESLIDGENVILITIIGKDESEKLEYKITVKKNIEELEEHKEEILETDASEENELIYVKYKWYIIGGIILLLVIILLVVKISIKEKRKKKDYDIEVASISECENINNIKDEKNNDEEQDQKQNNYKEKKYKRSYKQGKHS